MKLLIIMTIIGCVWPKTAINCPNNCTCDKLVTNFKRVKCTNLNLMNIGDDIPASVEVLDISYNQINELFEDEFLSLGLNSMKSLNISHNKIGHMHLNAFTELNKIRVIDLSYNIIEYILLEWFRDLPRLKQLHISNNNFFKLKAKEPLVESKSLQVLDISYCKLTQLSIESFSKLPSLESLKLDGNFLIEINPAIVKPSTNLQALSVGDNPLNCGKVMNDLKRYAKSSNIRYVDPCTKPKMPNVERSQKMIILDEEEKTKDNDLWMYEDEEDKDDDTPFCNCTKIEYQSKGLLLEIIELSPVLSVVVIMAIGFLLGLIIACSVQIAPSKTKVKRRPKRYSIIRRTFIENCDPLVLHCENVFESTPMTQRRVEMHPLR